jgi:KDO2-lipid IV(A) lauroyltransferase
VGWRDRAGFNLYRVGSRAAAALPPGAVLPLARVGGTAAWAALGDRRRLVERNMARALGEPVAAAHSSPAVRRATRGAFVAYARYWVESLRLPAVEAGAVDAAFSIDGRRHLEEARAAGRGAVLALPHVGGWEVGGRWLAGQGFAVSVVAETLEPPEMFEWFVRLRKGFGLNVIPLGAGAGTAVLRALRANHLVCLLCDRDIVGGGVEVELFGERTTLPAGPVVLAMRANTVVLPTAVYFDGAHHRAVVRPPLAMPRAAGGRRVAVEATQNLAHALEALIRRAPEQWHLFQPNWPSDRS